MDGCNPTKGVQEHDDSHAPAGQDPNRVDRNGSHGSAHGGASVGGRVLPEPLHPNAKESPSVARPGRPVGGLASGGDGTGRPCLHHGGIPGGRSGSLFRPQGNSLRGASRNDPDRFHHHRTDAGKEIALAATEKSAQPWTLPCPGETLGPETPPYPS
jgi:hypothetical protein